jgi:hypothetical protein
MPSRPDLRELASNVKEAFAEMDRDTLLEILTFVIKEYVVEGPPPMLVHQTETLADLQGLTFAQLIAALQTRFDFPELSMFAVDANQVSVRVGGVMQPLTAQRQPAAAAELPRPAAGVRVVETNVAQQRPAQPAAPPPPVRGVSVRGREAGAAPPAPPAQQPPAPPAAGQAAPQQPAPSDGSVKNDKPEGSGDDASARFSLLELD